MKETTRYYRNALKAASQEVIDFRAKAYSEIASNQLEEGKLDIEKIKNDLKLKWDPEKEDVKPIIIAAKTICLNYDYCEKTLRNVDQLTSLLFIPAIINKDGELLPPDDNQLPWIPREYLEPMCESVLSFGNMNDLDTFYNMTDSDRSSIVSWEKYYAYTKKFFGAVCNTDYEANEIIRGNDSYTFDNKYYAFLNDRVIPTHNIIALYDYLSENRENALYQKVTSGEEEPLKALIDINSIDALKKHVGQMNGEYSLSPSQRNAMNHFCNIEEGDVLAVSGPPGTGKTTLLQSIVANMYVERALKKAMPPIIVAASTNNQAVTNIIDSFGKINISFDELFEQKWIKGSNSFATFFPSGVQVAYAEKKGYQHTDEHGVGFIDALENEENKRASEENYLWNYNSFYKEERSDIKECPASIHKQLKKVDARRKKCLDIISDIGIVIGSDKTPKQRELSLEEELSVLNRDYSSLQSKKRQLEERKEEYTERFNLWNEAYYKLPWFVRVLKFLPIFRRRISNFIFGFMEDSELAFLDRSMSFDEIIDNYKKQIESMDKEIPNIENQMKEIQSRIDLFEKKLGELKKLVDRLTDSIGEAYDVLPRLKEMSPNVAAVNTKTLQELNDMLDVIRYVEFWLAVHYYEGMWLTTPNSISERQKNTTYESVLNTRYHRLAMISPCFVMTFYRLPKIFKVQGGNDKKDYYTDAFIDLLIVDEAGQATLEVAAASFALAQKAVVVGDEKQIPPVYGIAGAVDRAIAKEQKMIENYSKFEELEEKKLSCSSSSVMGRALLCCAYDYYEHGLFLSEHRRCYDEIIGYCNELLYQGKLEPKRGSAKEDKKRLVRDSSGKGIPPMSYVQIDSDASEKIGTSRINPKEAEIIAQWIKTNFGTLCADYSDTPCQEVLAVITPFKAQSDLIKRVLKKEAPSIADKIGVGTVHTFQGGEKKVILFSTVYGKSDGYYFIRTNANLMNVAVSRAKDAFMVFGDLRGFQNNPSSPDGLLKKVLERFA